MKKLIIISVLTLLFCKASSQILHPIKWSYAAKKTSKNEAVIFLKATIDEGWHIYSTVQKDGGPIKTSFLFTSSKDYDLIGTVSEPKPVTKYEKAFEMDVSYFENSVIFQQKVRLKAANVTVKGTLKFMTCNDKQCLPPETVSFETPIK